jgi:hypothetical protein
VDTTREYARARYSLVRQQAALLAIIGAFVPGGQSHGAVELRLMIT